MARKSTNLQSRGLGRLRSAAEAVKRVFTRKRGESEERIREPQHNAAPASVSRPVQPERPATRREADVPLDVLNRSYTPQLTSSKASFRSDGSDKEKDQELTPRTATDRWNDEDHYTNKSGDPRIGTHGRISPRAEEERAESRE